ncbi:hypothetical protein [Streptomyces sp. NPDC003077]|uniref:hypothetical protein n=1 Tax=Streptomyces sp. NPDC003077 TaxID=3154443 RepID=UPI0033B34801
MTMDTLQHRAEAQKIARLLGVEPSSLEFLYALPVEDVRQFRAHAVDALYDRAPDMLDRIAAATKLIPTGVAAAISQKALGPRLAASVAGRLDPSRAAGIIEKLPIDFTAESCAHLDPRRIPTVVERLDEETVVRVAVALAERGDFLTMGRFVGHLSDHTLERILQHLDDTVVLKVGFFIDLPERLDAVLDLMGEQRVASVIRAAGDANGNGSGGDTADTGGTGKIPDAGTDTASGTASDPASYPGVGLWPEALAIATMAGPAWRTRIAALAARQEPERLDGLVRATHAQHLWEALLPLVALLDEDDLRTVAALPSLRDPEVLAAIVPAVVATGSWSALLPLTTELPEPSRKVVADATGALPDAELEALALEVAERDLWDAVLPLIALMADPAKERVLALPAFRERDTE